MHINNLYSVFFVICGFILGFILGKIILKENVYHGPNAKDIMKRIYKDDVTNECYKLVPVPVVCPSKMSMKK